MAIKINTAFLLKKIKKESPIIHHITNWVTIYDCAQVVKSLGASPVMAHAPEEAAQMAKIASSLVLNIGTLTLDLVESMKLAARAANNKGVPVVFDICGVGATKMRDNKSLELLDRVRIDIIKGNASEVARILGENVSTRGVDSGEIKSDLIKLAKKLALKRKATVVITGETDIVTNGKELYLVKNGDSLMSKVVGTGCMAASMIGAFAAVEENYARAAASGLAVFGVAAEIASSRSDGPGTFKAFLFDALYSLTADTLNKRQKILCY
ncbi:MAG: hydroxyethylthiazole kinase [Candidatus Omnitrophica bacterium]|nr:hydroxyethylthiazole kinase [Candidatus Omnitrophota bacterium]